jgi:uncharacterized heparinase superfamily protein
MPTRRRQSLQEGNSFSFLNKTGSLDQLGWNGPEREKIWRYNQHYFDDLNAVNSGLRSDLHHELIKRWVSENEPGKGIGWESYPISLRIANWVKWCLSGNLLDDVCLQSMAVQVRYLMRRVEWHILGNHLFANAKALVFAGLFFDGPEARKWLDTGLDIIERELLEQVLPDGGNFERSPMYHSIFLEDVLDLINLSNAYPGMIGSIQLNQLRRVAARMLIWMEEMCHPDGEISFFNDAVIGVAPSPAEIKTYANSLGISVDNVKDSSNFPSISEFSYSGYIRLDASDASLFLDVAPVGPDYLPGHAHADTLSFELSLFGERFFVNSGISQYGVGLERLYERGTKAHNTVTINNQNSSEVWSGFRVARRAYPIDLRIIKNEKSIFVRCAHDGYKRLIRPVVHNRSWELDNIKLVVKDQIDGNFESAIARFHFHPNMNITVVNQSLYSITLPGSGKVVQLFVTNGTAAIEKSFYCPEFGIRLDSHCLVISPDATKNITLEILWGING